MHKTDWDYDLLYCTLIDAVAEAVVTTRQAQAQLQQSVRKIDDAMARLAKTRDQTGELYLFKVNKEKWEECNRKYTKRAADAGEPRE